jgi:hypothetical protein
MSAQIRSMVLVPLVLLAAATLSACGDSSTASGDSSSLAARHAAADKIIADAVGPNPKASSGRIDGSIELEVKGVPRFQGPIELTANGVYNLPAGAAVPDVDIDVGVSLNSGVLGGAIVVAGETGYIKLGNAGYKLPAWISKALVAPAREAKNGLTKTGAMFYINPHDWQKNARVVGEESIAGESTQKITADILVDRAVADVARLVDFLTLIHVPQALGLPTELTPKMQAAFVRSVKDVTGEVWMGTDDHVLRKAHLTGKMVVAEKDRKVLLGATSGTLEATLNISRVGDPQKISAPTQLDSYANLRLSLDALAEAAGQAGR